MTVAWLLEWSEQIEFAIAGYLECEDDLPDEFRGQERQEDDGEEAD